MQSLKPRDPSLQPVEYTPCPLPSDNPTKMMQDDVINRFTYHPPHGDQPTRYDAIRGLYRDLALRLLEMAPASRERSLALTHLEDSSMWLNKAIACNEP